MKKIFSILSCALLLSTAVSCDWFELDNQEGWNAKVQGKIIDAKTGQPVQSEQGNYLVVVEKGWDAEENQGWRIKNDGTYRNDLVFAGNYEMRTLSLGNFQCDPQPFTLNKGDNTVDFKVNPFCRIINPTVTYDSAAKKIKATFSIENGIPEVNNIGRAYLCVYPDRFVKVGYNKCSADPGAQTINIDPTDGHTVTLEVDMTLDKNAEEFQYDRPHYIRIAAVGAHYGIVPEWVETKTESVFDMDAYLAAGSPSDWWNYFVQVETKIVHPAEYTNDGSVNVNNYYNYSPVFKLENGTITEVTDW